MQRRDIIVIGSSAGGIESLQQLVQDLPAGLPAAVCIVQHILPGSPSLLASILERVGRLPALSPEDGVTFEHGHIYVAPPDHHLLVQGTKLRVLRGPTENRHRPAVDPLFRSAAWSCGPRVVGVVLSGAMDDGTAGLWAVKSCGGTTVVQDPDDALFPWMPRNALRQVEIDHCLPLSGMGRLLTELVHTPVKGGKIAAVPEKIAIETEAAMLESGIADMNRIGVPSIYTCPACKGSLWEITEGTISRYRCHVGHSYLPESLVADQSDYITAALYSALAAMEEKAAMLRRIASRLGEALPKERTRYLDLARREDEQAEIIKGLIRHDPGQPGKTPR